MGCIVNSRSFDDDDAPHRNIVALLRRPPNILSACVWFCWVISGEINISGLMMAMKKADSRHNISASIFLASRQQGKRPIRGKISHVNISALAMAMKKADSRQNIWRPYILPRDGNEKCRFEERYLASYFSPHDGNKKGRFEARYLASKYLASRRQ